MEQFLDKNYVLVSTKNFEDYLAFIGVGYLGRKAAVKLKPVQCLSLNSNGAYTFTFKSTLVNSTITFIPGQEFVETKPDGVQVKAVITIDDNKIIHIQTEDNGRISRHVREFFPNEMIVTTTAEGFDKTAIRRYTLLQ